MGENRSMMRRLFGVSEKRSAGSTQGYQASVLPPSRSAVTDVSVDRALSLPAVYRSVSIISTTVAQLELAVWRNGAEIPTPSLVARPDVDQSLSQFLKRTTIGLAVKGNAYWRVFKNPDGSVATVKALNPLAVTVDYDEQGRKQYHYSGDQFGRSRTQTFTSAQVQHLRLLEVPGLAYGLGPIQSARLSITGALDLREYSSEWFQTSGVPTGVLTTDMNLTPEEAEAARKQWHEQQAKRQTAVMGRGLSYAPVMLSPADAQFLESQQFTVTDIARLFGVPAAYLLAEVNGSSMTYQSLEMADTAFLRTTLMGYLSEIEDALTVLLPRGQKAKFRTDGLLRPDAMTQAEVHRIYAEIGAISLDEIRAEKGWTGPPPKPPKAPVPLPAPTPEDVAS